MSYFAAAAPEVAGRDVHHSVRQVEVAHDLFFDGHEELQLVPARARMAEGEHLDLVELVHAEHAAHVLAVGARLAPEARRVARVPERQRALVDDLAHMQSGERASDVPTRYSWSASVR